MSIPALDGTVECNNFLCFNPLNIDRKKDLPSVVSKHQKGLKILFLNVHEGTFRRHEDYYPDYSKSDNSGETFSASSNCYFLMQMKHADK